jgi:membrane-bound metal-dependent hydrolase YbcI (DUF457 family)
VAFALAALVYAAFGSPALALGGAAGAALTTFVGAIYPDVDHDESIPRRKAVRGFRVLAGLVVLGLAAANWDAVLAFAGALGVGASVPPPVVGAALAGLAALVGVALVDPVIGLVTREHRGWTHSAAVNLVLVGALVALSWLATAGLAVPERLVAVAVVGAVYPGTLVHLWLDGEVP